MMFLESVLFDFLNLPNARKKSVQNGRRHNWRKTKLRLEHLEDRTTPSSIHGMKFLDLNHDGIKGEAELGLNGWDIELVNRETSELRVVTTMDKDLNDDGEIDPFSERGLYWFDDLEAGEYSVREVQQLGWRQSTETRLARTAYQLDQTHDLFRYAEDHEPADEENWGWRGEKWFQSANSGDLYFITPDGEVYLWDGESGPMHNQDNQPITDDDGEFHYQNQQT